MVRNVSIHSVGIYLPPTIRENEHWSPETVAGWGGEKKGPPSKGPATPSSSPKTASQLAAWEVRGKLHDDPFQGARRRRLADPEMTESQMQVLAARDAVTRAGISVSDIQLCLTASSVPDHLTAPDVCLVHRELELPRDVLSLQIDNACASFVQQLQVAAAMLRPGRFALLTQGCLGSKLCPPLASHAPWFGDGATAVVVGPCEPGEGLLGFANATDGSTHEALVTGVPGGTWRDEGTPYFHIHNRAAGAQMLGNACAWGKEVTEAARLDAGVKVQDITFFACHQGQAWLREAVQGFAGLEHARTLDTFAEYASLACANIPLILRLAEDAGDLGPGDVVQAFTGGVGETFASAVFRW